MSDWGDRIKARRDEADMSQADLARACKVSPPSVNDWESGKTKSLKGASLIRVAAALRCTATYITDGRPVPRPFHAGGSSSEPYNFDNVSAMSRDNIKRIIEAAQDSGDLLDEYLAFMASQAELLVKAKKKPSPHVGALGKHQAALVGLLNFVGGRLSDSDAKMLYAMAYRVTPSPDSDLHLPVIAAAQKKRTTVKQ